MSDRGSSFLILHFFFSRRFFRFVLNITVIITSLSRSLDR